MTNWFLIIWTASSFYFQPLQSLENCQIRYAELQRVDDRAYGCVSREDLFTILGITSRDCSNIEHNGGPAKDD